MSTSSPGTATGSRCTHHLELDDPAHVDDEVCGWLELAFELAR